MLGGRHGTLFIFFFFFSQTPKPATGGGADVGQVDTGCQRRNLGPNLGRQKLRRLGRGPGSSAEQPLVNPASSAGAERLTVEGRKTGWLSVRLSVRPFVRQQRVLASGIGIWGSAVLEAGLSKKAFGKARAEGNRRLPLKPPLKK